MEDVSLVRRTEGEKYCNVQGTVGSSRPKEGIWINSALQYPRCQRTGRHEAYTCICACGPNPAVLHYGHAGAPNARIVRTEDTALLDMGAEYHCYCSDITCSFPLSSTFSPDQRVVYEGVFKAQLAVCLVLLLAQCRPLDLP